ncbi:MAG: Uma2 family endonuclease [Runella slithyformis]|jgi:Uma2 family endonuclease|nr:MAG: Uma2 family endonuclease [Runella slithyformis]TAF25490.1 MAG: Uma2 family endonuclease [Runella slithyformis]TAF43810.1 MAG: Uma2 family endonuclease [Runella slithyformis]TAF79888.1 MAG: Uma2 family endonuclease [Runella slithyformis]TAH10595.1 MAG: Uma2 family endonuclease [Runella slithyformis]
MITETLVSVEEYFDLLLKSNVKLEYNAGEIVAMAGGQPAHNLAAANLIVELSNCLRKKGCIVLTSDQLIKVEGCEKYTFPDLVVVCQKPVYEKAPQGLDALINPEIIVEVLSDSTEFYDRTEKFDCYKTIDSFREYVLVSSKKRRVEVHKKLNEAEWLSHVYGEKDEKVKIDNCDILLDNIYYGVVFAQPNATT